MATASRVVAAMRRLHRLHATVGCAQAALPTTPATMSQARPQLRPLTTAAPLDPATSLQNQYAPEGICFGCGAANPKGLQIKSFEAPDDDQVAGSPLTLMTADFVPQQHHLALPGVVNGGVISALLDCASNWVAMEHYRREDGLDAAPLCSTGKYEVTFLAPTPAKSPLRVKAHAVEFKGRKARVDAQLICADNGEVTATSTGVFFRLKDDHPAVVAMRASGGGH